MSDTPQTQSHRTGNVPCGATRAPVIVMGFQRGGTNILMNLLSSHPALQRTGAEFHEVFFGRDVRPIGKWVVRALAAPILLAAGPGTFWPYRYDERVPLPSWAAAYARTLIFATRWRGYHHEDRPEGSRSHRERARARGIIKAVNGLVFAFPLFDSLYPGSFYVGLVRDPVALGHGFIRRGWSAERFAEMYRRVGDRLAAAHDARDDVVIVRFEDMLASPVQVVRDIWASAGLDPLRAESFKLQAKATTQRDGRRALSFGARDREIGWFDAADLPNYLHTDVNSHQREQLSVEQIATIASIAGVTAHRLGYRLDA